MSYRPPSVNGTSSPTVPSGVGGPTNQFRPMMPGGPIENGPSMSQPPGSGPRPGIPPSLPGGYGHPSQQYNNQPPMMSKGQVSGPPGMPNRPPYGPTSSTGQPFPPSIQTQRPGMQSSPGLPPVSMPYNRPQMSNGPPGPGMPTRTTGPPRMGPPVSSSAASAPPGVPPQFITGPPRMGPSVVGPQQVQSSSAQNQSGI